MDLPWYILVGKATLVLLLIQILASTYRAALRLRFEKWRGLHDILAPLVLVFGFLHSWNAGNDLETYPLRILWVVALAYFLGWLLVQRIVRPRRLKARSYRVVAVQPETDDVWTVTLSPPPGQAIEPYLPGQFHFITFYRSGNLPVEEHHWTISSSPTRTDTVSSSTKALGDFTSTMGKTQTGDRAAVQGPFGRFSHLLHPEEKDLVFVAGGIGITPFISMLRHMKDSKDARRVLLFYANRGEQNILFRQELSEIRKGGSPALEVVHVLSRPPEGWSGETGHVDREKIEGRCGSDLKGKTYYVCGPTGLRRAMLADLAELGVAARQIRVEIFTLLD